MNYNDNIFAYYLSQLRKIEFDTILSFKRATAWLFVLIAVYIG